jgi:pyridoxal phosphate enzyme (YggS family)
MMTPLRENLERLEAAIQQACRRAGRTRNEVELMAVSKTYPATTICDAADLGLRLFGENRVQEYSAKAHDLAALRGAGSVAAVEVCSLSIHLIGHLQSNKTARAAELFDGVDSLDSVRLAERLNEAATNIGKTLPVLVEVKLSPEEAKSGVEPESDEAAQLLERLPDLPHLDVRGVMTIAPWGVAEDVTRACFRSLRQWRDRWAATHPRLHLDVLSMGMSADFPIAIEEGATRIRIGTALFGPRKKPGADGTDQADPA